MQRYFKHSRPRACEVYADLRAACRVVAAGLLSCTGIHMAVVADDACSANALYAYANVTASDGKSYAVESFYRSKDRAASNFIQADGNSLHVVDGPFTWVQAQGEAEIAKGAQADFQRDYALGHQFHALMFHFKDIVTNIEPVSDIDFAGKKASALKGIRDTGGEVFLIDGETAGQPAGIRFDVGELKIDIIASDWRDVGGTLVPFALLIDDGSRTFNYQYQTIDMQDRPPMWFYDNVTAPDIDAVQILRLHKKSLAAHCLGDAAMLAGLAAPAPVIISGGSLFETSPDQMKDIFTGTFTRRTYSNYIATRHPVIEVSDSGDIGWASVQVNAKGITEATGQPFDEHWAWVMLAKKINGEWRMAGNAANSRR